MVSVRYHLDGSMLTIAAGRRAFDRIAAQIVPDLFARFSAIDLVIIEADASTVDIRGHKGRAAAAQRHIQPAQRRRHPLGSDRRRQHRAAGRCRLVRARLRADPMIPG